MSEARPARLLGLDIFRGLAVAGMIIVNTPGSWDYVWAPLDHAEWNGWTPTDLVFPSFLFAVGVALGVSFPRGVDASTWARVARRIIALIALGWAFQLLAHSSFASFRFPGVLQRIALCYALAAALGILTASRDQQGRSHLRPSVLAGSALAALLAYWLLMAAIPVPGHGAGVLTPEGNLASYVDRAVFTTRHIWSGGTDAAGNIVYDPEGLLSTIPALANVLFGMLAALAWRRTPNRSQFIVALGGLILLAAGLLLDPIFPINKKLWTSSFALFTSGAAALMFASCMVAARSTALRRLFTPFTMLGMNAILGYSLSLLVGIAGFRLLIGGVALQDRGFGLLHAIIGNPYLASFTYAALVLLLVMAMLVPFHRRGIHLRL